MFSLGGPISNGSFFGSSDYRHRISLELDGKQRTYTFVSLPTDLLFISFHSYFAPVFGQDIVDFLSIHNFYRNTSATICRPFFCRAQTPSSFSFPSLPYSPFCRLPSPCSSCLLFLSIQTGSNSFNGSPPTHFHSLTGSRTHPVCLQTALIDALDQISPSRMPV